VDYLSVDDLTTERLPGEDFTIEGLGTVRIRGLSRFEVLAAQKQKDAGVAAMERVMLSCAMVEPRMSEAQVTAWQKATPAGLLEPLTRRVQALSGMGEGAEKAQYKSDGGGPDS